MIGFKLVVFGNDQCELFDLVNDPAEAVNLFDNPAYAEVQSELMLKMMRRQQCQGQDPEDLPVLPRGVHQRNPKSFGPFEMDERLPRIEALLSGTN